MNVSRLRHLAAVLALTVVARTTAPAQSPAAATLDGAIAHELSARGGVGASVAVVRDGAPVLVKTYGRRSIDPPRPADDSTLFGIGSVTKQFTSAIILMLAEDGRLSVDDKVAKWYPGLTRAQDISVLDLMNHVSGYPDYYPLDFVDRRMQKAIDPDGFLKEYAGGRLDFEPGTRWSYSNTGFILLGRIAEKASGMPFATLLRQRIFAPVGMSHTVYEVNSANPDLAMGYTSFALTPLTVATREGAGWVGSAGAIYSTAGDLAKWDIALMDGRLLKPESWKRMTTARLLKDGRSTHYGCGVGIAERNGVTIFTHGGAVSGFIARNIFIPSTHSAVAVLVNDEDNPLAGAIVDKALDAVLPKERNVPVTRGPSAAGDDRGQVPHIDGPDPAAAARALFTALQTGRIDRASISPDFSGFLTDAKLQAASRSLLAYGAPTAATVRLAFESGALDALMYRSPDGKIQEFFVMKP